MDFEAYYNVAYIECMYNKCKVSKEVGTVNSKIDPVFKVDEILHIFYFETNIWRVSLFQI